MSDFLKAGFSGSFASSADERRPEASDRSSTESSSSSLLSDIRISSDIASHQERACGGRKAVVAAFLWATACQEGRERDRERERWGEVGTGSTGRAGGDRPLRTRVESEVNPGIWWTPKKSRVDLVGGL